MFTRYIKTRHFWWESFIITTTFMLVLFAQLSVAEENPSPSLSLDQAVAEGLSANIDLLAAKYNIPLAEADELTAGLWANPSLGLNASLQPFGKNWNGSNAGGPKQEDLTLNYPVDLSGKRSASKKSAQEGVHVAQVTFEDAVRLKVEDIRLAYIEVVVQEHQLALLKEKEQSLKNLLTVTENRVGGTGRMPLLVMRAQLALDQARLDSRQKEISLKAAIVQLVNLLGRQQAEKNPVAGTKLREFKMMDIPSKEKLIEQALEIRPDLLALKKTVTKSEYDKDLAKAQVWDDFQVNAGITKQGPTSANPDDPASQALGDAHSWSLGVTIPLPMFNRNQGNIKKAELTIKQTEKLKEAKELAIRQEVAGLYDQLLLGRSLIEEYESKQLKRARDVRDAQQRQFGTGNSALLDYLDAISAYQGAVSSYYDTLAEYRKNLARLSAAIGKDLNP